MPPPPSNPLKKLCYFYSSSSFWSVSCMRCIQLPVVTFTSHCMSCVRALQLTACSDRHYDTVCVHIMSQISEIRISFDGGATSLNFAEAALLIQGSTCVYSRKVSLSTVVLSTSK